MFSDEFAVVSSDVDEDSGVLGSVDADVSDDSCTSSAACATGAAAKNTVPKRTDATPNEYFLIEKR